MTEYTNISQITGVKHTMSLNCTKDQLSQGFIDYDEKGMLLQDAFHFLDAGEREFLRTGITPDEWDLLFKQRS